MHYYLRLVLILGAAMTASIVNSSCPLALDALLYDDGTLLSTLIWKESSGPPMSIIDIASLSTGQPIPNIPTMVYDFNKTTLVCESSAQEKTAMLDKVQDSLVRSFKFLESHMDEIRDISVVFSLEIIRAYDNQHKVLQKQFPLSRWMSDICNSRTCDTDDSFCKNMNKSSWAPVLATKIPHDLILQEIQNLEDIGKEKETLTNRLLSKCQSKLWTHCAVDEECSQKFFHDQPRTLYMLSHQLLHRMLAKAYKCEDLEQFENKNMETSLCSKMYMESQLISFLNYPPHLRDIFSENVGLCGAKGYPNIFRRDWLEHILKWQSKSDFGCFLDSEGTGDVQITRRQTKAETQRRVKPKEVCGSHFTAVSMIALAGFWDHLLRGC